MEEDERKPDCALTCGGYDPEYCDDCDHRIEHFDVEPDDFPPGTD